MKNHKSSMMGTNVLNFVCLNKTFNAIVDLNSFNMQNKSFIINEIINFMKAKKITGYEIQQRTNGEITEVAINKIISGKTKIPQNSTIKILENFLRKNYGYFRALNLQVSQSGRADAIQRHQDEYSRGEEATGVSKDPRSKYVKSQKIEPAACTTCEEKERIIAGKDKQIEALERLIASKDEMLAMKEEAIKGKDEIISIQSKRISELESRRETEESKKILGSVERIDQENASLTDIQPKDLSAKAKKDEYQP